MFHAFGDVTDLRMPEIGPHLLGAAPGTPQVPCHVFRQFRDRFM